MFELAGFTSGWWGLVDSKTERSEKMAGNSNGTAKKPRGKPFRKGQSGNPSGRPKNTPEQKDALAAIRDLAPNAADVLQQIMVAPNAPAAARIRAAVEILDRTYGKAETPIKVDDEKRDILSDIRSDVERIKAGIKLD